MSKVFILQLIFCLVGYCSTASANQRPKYNKNKWQKVKKPTPRTFSKKRTKPKLISPKKHGIGLNAGVVYANFGYGVEYYYSPITKIHLGGQFLTTSVDLKGGTYEGGQQEFTNLTLYNINGFFRYVPWSFLYISGGLNIDSISGTYGFENINSNEKLQVSYDTTQLRIHGAVGSEWRFNHWLLFGVDWFGYSQGLLTQLKAGTDPNLEQTIAFHQSTTVKDRLSNELSLQTQFYFLLGRVTINF